MGVWSGAIGLKAKDWGGMGISVPGGIQVTGSAYRKPAFQPSAFRRPFIGFQPSAENQPYQSGM